jgi:HAD superfamily hydrolase (TIGR01549 family)
MRGLLFDLDGTLVDTNYLHTLAWARALRDAGEDAPMNAIHRLVGMGGDQLVPRLLGHDCEQAAKRRPVRYRELMGDARPFEHAVELLRTCRGLGLEVVIATSAPKDELEPMMDLLENQADRVTSADDVERSKPDPEVFVKAKGGLERAIVVGDSVWDVEAARAAGLGCIGVETGGFSRHELAEAGALHVYRDVGVLLDQLHVGPVGALLVP